MTLLFNFLSLPDHVVSQIKALAKIIYRQQMINWMKFLKVTILFFCYQQVEAQVSKDALDGMTSYMLIEKININGFHHQVYIKNIEENTVEAQIPPEDPNAPQQVTALKKMMDYDADQKGEEYVLYWLDDKSQKILELTFPKQIKDAENKIIAEGSYSMIGKNLKIVILHFDYHFPAKMVTMYRLNRIGRISLVDRKAMTLDPDSFSNDYIKRAREKNIILN